MIIDSHLHIPIREQDTEYDDSEIEFWENASSINITEKLNYVSQTIKHYNIEKGILYLLDNKWNDNKWFPVEFIPDNLIIGMEIDLTIKPEQIKILKELGIKFIKLLPYERKIFKCDYEKVLYLAREIEKNNMVLTICCSYGSKYLYNTNGVELTSFLVINGIKSPIIMAHGGMLKVLDAFSLMREYDNLYMDLSFTIPFWEESSILQDYAFVLKKLNYEKIFYGSDYPYISIEKSLSSFEAFFEKFNLSKLGKEKIYYNNILELLNKTIKEKRK